MEVKPWHKVMLKQVFEDAIYFNMKEAEYYKGQHYETEHLEKVKQYEELMKGFRIKK